MEGQVLADHKFDPALSLTNSRRILSPGFDSELSLKMLVAELGDILAQDSLGTSFRFI
jgi:hypothetical protein